MDNDFKISDFLSSYPEFDEDVGEILGYDVVNQPSSASYDIYKKKEFYDHRLKRIEEKPENPGQYMDHQTIVSRFLSSHTSYNGLLLFHDPGTGKTCSSVAIIEGIKKEVSAFTGALILMKGKGLVDNYKNELVNYCTDGIYKPTQYDTEGEKLRRTNKKIEEYYEFNTFEIFSKNIGTGTDNYLQQQYNNKIIVIDEVHNLRIADEQSQYYNIHRFLHIVKNCKILLMSGTPMRDQPQEISSIMNLILPLDMQLPTDKQFVEKYLIKQKDSVVVNPEMAKDLKKYFRGRVSYVRTMQSDVQRTFMGEKMINYFNLYTVNPSEFQTEAYKKAYEIDMMGGGNKKGRGVYNNSSQADLLVFPDGSWGPAGFKKYIKQTQRGAGLEKGKKGKIIYSMSPEFLKYFSGKTSQEKLAQVRKLSSKYADCIEGLLKNENECEFAYIEFVEGSGAIVFSKILELFGFRQASGGENTEAKRYGLITGKTSKAEITKILNTQVSSKNIFGKYIRIVIGSQVIGEGFTLKNIQRIRILTPHWNFSETDQAIARGIRLFSHKDLENAGVPINVKIYLYCLGIDPIKDSIDFKMYKTSEDKDISIKSIEHLMKEASFDCPLNRARNIIPSSFDYRRECDYQPCNYQCDNIDEKMYEEVDIDYSTYNLFYSQKDLELILEQIKNILITKPNVKLYEIFNVFTPTFSHFIIFKAIDTLVSGKEIIKDNLGYSCIVKHTGDCLYLTYNFTDYGNFFDNFYLEHFPLREYPQFNREADIIYSDNLPNIFDKMEKEKNPAKKIELLQKFSIDAKELMLELAIKSLESGEVMNDQSIRKFIIENFKPYIKKLKDNVTVSTFIPDENFRCFKNETKVWEDCDEKYKDEINKIMKEEKVSLENNPYGYYGIFETENSKFSIRDVTQKKDEKDKRKVSKGKACNPSWEVGDLLKLVDIMKFEFNPKNPENYDSKSKEDLIKYRDKKDYKDVKAGFSEEELKSKTKEDIMRILFWSFNYKKKIICERIQKWFEDNNLIEVVAKKDK